MIICSYKSLLNKAKEIRGDIEREGQKSKKSVDELVSRMKTTHKLTSLCHIYTDLKDYKPHIPVILDPPTSGFSSDCYEDDAKLKRVSSLSYTEVKNLLIDTSVLTVFPKANSVREGKNILLMVSNIKLDIDYFKFKEFLLSLRAPPLFYKVKFLFYKGNYSLLLQFSKHDQARSFFYSLTKKISNFEKFFGNNFDVDWVEINLSNSPGGKQYNFRDKSCFIKEDFYAVIVRNLPPDTKISDIENFLLNKAKVKAKIQQICYLKREHFTLVILPNIESAEIACTFLNDKLIKSKETLTSKQIKAHLHPRCCKKRSLESESIFRNLFRGSGVKDAGKPVGNIEAVKTLLQKINQKEGKKSQGKKSVKKKKVAKKEEKKKKREATKSPTKNKRKSKSRKSKSRNDSKLDVRAPLPKSPPPPLPAMKMEDEKKMIQGKLSLNRKGSFSDSRDSKRVIKYSRRSRSRSRSKKRRKGKVNYYDRSSEERSYSHRRRSSKHSAAGYNSKKHRSDYHKSSYRRESREKRHDYYRGERSHSRRYEGDRHNDEYYRQDSKRYNDHKYDDYDGKKSSRKLKEINEKIKNRKRKRDHEERKDTEHGRKGSYDRK